MKTCREIFESIDMGDNCGSVKHNHYLEIYDKYLNPYRNKKINILEIGVQAGGSMKLWEEYFPCATIYGIDRSKECKKFESERIKIYTGNQNDTEFLNRVACGKEFSVIIDDGSHVCEHQRISFETLFDYLTHDGIYIIEDTQTSYWRTLGGASTINNQENFIEYSKELVECVNACALNRDKIINRLNKYNWRIESIHFHNSIVVIQKGKTNGLELITTKGYKVL